MRENERIKK